MSKDLKRNSVEIKKVLKYLPSIVEMKNYEYGLYKILNNVSELGSLIGSHDLSSVEWVDGSECPKSWLYDCNSVKKDCLNDITNNGVKKINYLGGSNPKHKNAFLISVKENDLVYVYALRKNESCILADKELNKIKINRPWLINLLNSEIEKGNIKYFRDYLYTDDYAWDNASNFGKSKDWQIVEVDSYLHRSIIDAVKSSCYNINGDKNSDLFEIFSSWNSFNVKIVK